MQVRNEGLIAHAIIVGRELERLTWGPDERLEQDFFTGVEVARSGNGLLEARRGTELTVYPGGSAVFTFSVPAGKTGHGRSAASCPVITNPGCAAR